MANIIIIEDDIKVVSQFRDCFKELGGDHRLRFFATSEEFQNIYLKNAAQKAKSSSYHPLFQPFRKEQMDWLLSTDLAPTSPFAKPIAKIIMNKEGKIIAFDKETKESGIAFGKTLKEISQIKSITSLINSQFHSLWESFCQNLSEKKVISTALPFIHETETTWLLKVSAKKSSDDTIEMVLRHQPDFFEPILQTERKLQQSQDKDSSEELQLLSTIHMIIFRVNSVQSNTHEWIDNVSKKMEELNYNPEDFRIRFVATMFEDTVERKLQLMHPQLDDIIYLPLDRLMFIQKMEIILHFPQKTSPSFLFADQGTIHAEISNRIFIERISEAGFAICSSNPLHLGTLSRFKFRLPLDKTKMITTLAKSFHCTNHPEAVDEQLVYFYFFGINKEDKKIISTYLNSLNSYKGLKSVDDKNFEYDPSDQTLSDYEKEMKHVIILDIDIDAAELLKGLIQESIDQVKIYTENSYYLFLRNHLKVEYEEEELTQEDKNDENNIPLLAEAADGPIANLNEVTLVQPGELFAENISWIISCDTFECKEVMTPPKIGDQILGHDASTFFIPGTHWQKLFLGKENIRLLEESLRVVTNHGKKVRRNFALFDYDGSPKWMQANFVKNHKPNEIVIKLEALKESSPFWRRRNEGGLERLDMLIVSEEMVPENVNSWSKGIINRATKAGLVQSDRQPKIVVISDKISSHRMQIYRHSKLDGLHLKPIDIRAFLFELTVLLQVPFSKHRFENQTWVESHIPVHITKEVILENFSEFGADVNYHTSIQPGTILYLHENIFDKAPNNCLTARFYHSEEHPSEKDMFSCSFLYYGITEAFLKYCRTWIRENYVAKKTKE